MAKPSKSLADEAPALSLPVLRRAGLFDGHASVVIDLGPDLYARCSLQSPQLLHVEWLGGEQVIALERARLHYGRATYFTRPEGGGRCTKLYLADYRLQSRQALDLAYATQRMSEDERLDHRLQKAARRLAGEGGRRGARGKAKLRMLEELQAAPDRLPTEAWAELDKEADRKRASRRRRPLRSDPVMSTRWALLRGRTTQPRLTSAEIVAQLEMPPEVSTRPVAPASLSALQDVSARRAAYPELDIRALKPRRGAARGHKLVWDHQGVPTAVLASIRGVGPARRLRLEIWTGEGFGQLVARQELGFIAGRRPGDLFLTCPVTGRRSLKLYLRAGRFASAQAQRLR